MLNSESYTLCVGFFLFLFTFIKGVYLPQYKISKMYREHKFREYLLTLRKSQINAVVLGVKNTEGYLSFEVDHPLFKLAGKVRGGYPLKKVLAISKSEGFYTIVRIVAFKDSLMAPFTNEHYGQWVSPFDSDYRDYLLTILDSVLVNTPDEVQWDYVRWPDVTDYGEIDIPLEQRCEVLEEFLNVVSLSARERYIFTSADIFGRVCFAASEGCIDSIGQDVVGIARYCDFISPMIYPSHYKQSMRADPYGTVKETILNCLTLIEDPEILRPYLQAFRYRVPEDMPLEKYIREELKYIYEGEFKLNGILFWNPGGDYRILLKILKENEY